jgi:membrane protein
MSGVSAPPPIPGEVIDPPPKDAPGFVARLDEASDVAGIAYRAFTRFSYGKASLLAAGTTYYSFLAMFSVVAFGYGITALLGADQIASWLTESLDEAFPGLLGDDGVDPATLRRVGQATSIIGLVGLLYAGAGVMVAASASLHQIFGAPPDPRNYVLARLRLLAYFAIAGPLIMVSYAASTVAQQFSSEVLDLLGIESLGGRWLLTLATLLLSLALNFAIYVVLLRHLGGIRPPRDALLIAAGIGAVLVEILKYFMGLLISLMVDKPEYGALAAPIAILVVLFLQAMLLYGVAAIAAGIADKDVPLEEIVPDADDFEEAHAEVLAHGDDDVEDPDEASDASAKDTAPN